MGNTSLVPYDYYSVLHYPGVAFSKPKAHGPTIRTLSRNRQGDIGRARTASRLDYEKVCRLYGCDTCNRRPYNDCVPDLSCTAYDLVERPEFFYEHCCGRSGPGTLFAFCKSMAGNTTAMLLWAGKKKMCPWMWRMKTDPPVLCSECEPHNRCSIDMIRANATEEDRKFYRWQCCQAACGPVWSWYWCGRIPTAESHARWAEVGMC